MPVFKRGSNWYIDIQNDGRRIRKCMGPNKEHAENALEGMKELNQHVRFNGGLGFDMKFTYFAEQYAKYLFLCFSATKDNVGSLTRLKTFFGKHYLPDITAGLVKEYEAQKQDETMKDLAMLKHMFALAIKCGKAITNPVDETKPDTRDLLLAQVISTGDIDNLLNACEPFEHLFVYTSYVFGFSKDFLVNLKCREVDFKRKVISVLQNNGEALRIPPIFNDGLFEILKDLKRNQASDYAFSPFEPEKTIQMLDKAWKEALKKAGVKNHRFEDLRTTHFVNNLVRGGGPDTIQHLIELMF
jgi:integrase